VKKCFPKLMNKKLKKFRGGWVGGWAAEFPLYVLSTAVNKDVAK
jgi:hypothetical protein